jgi:hypothetical protein
LQQTVSPAWWSASNYSNVDKELSSLITSTGDNSIIPNIPNSYYTKNGARYDMTAKEYTNYKISVGTNSHEALDYLIKTNYYSKLENEDKIKLIKKIYSLSRENAQNKLDTCGLDFKQYSVYYSYCSSILKNKTDSLKFINSLSILSISKNKLIEALGY